MIGRLKKTAMLTSLLATAASGVWAQDVTLKLHQLLPMQATIPANAI